MDIDTGASLDRLCREIAASPKNDGRALVGDWAHGCRMDERRAAVAPVPIIDRTHYLQHPRALTSS